MQSYRQVKFKLNFSEATYKVLEERAKSLGIPITAYVKHIIFEELEGRTEAAQLRAEGVTPEEKHELEKLINIVQKVIRKQKVIENYQMNGRYW